MRDDTVWDYAIGVAIVCGWTYYMLNLF